MQVRNWNVVGGGCPLEPVSYSLGLQESPNEA